MILLIIKLESAHSLWNKSFEIFKGLLDDLCVHGSLLRQGLLFVRKFIKFDAKLLRANKY